MKQTLDPVAMAADDVNVMRLIAERLEQVFDMTNPGSVNTT